ncbi:MAG: MFS transporter [Rhodospirillales bacterium]|nr:MFS transporter [Rhodospirillales bacterium]
MTSVLPALVSTLMIQVVISFSGIAGPVLAPLAAEDLGVETYLIGAFVSLTYGVAAVAGLMSGGFIARFGALRVSQATLVLAAGGLACAAIGTIASVIVAALLIGMAYGPATPASSHILARVTPPAWLNLVFSLKQTGVPLGNMLAGAVLPTLALAIGWRPAVLVVATACLAIAIAVQPLRAGFDRSRERAQPIFARSHITSPLRLVFASPDLTRFAVSSVAYSGMQVSLSAFLVTYLHDGLDMSLVLAGIVLSAAQGAGVAGRILWGALADRFVNPQRLLGVLGLGMSVCAIATGLFTGAWPFIAVLAVCVAFGGTAVAWNGVYLAQVARLSPPGRAGEVTGGTSFFTFGGVVFAPSAFSAILAATGSYFIGFTAMAVMTLAASLSYFRAAAPRPAVS